MTANDNFPETRWSLIVRARAADSGERRAALEEICRTYWLPVYAFSRGLGLQSADAENLTQDVLSSLIKNKVLDRVSEEGGRMRSFLRVVTKNHLRNQWKKANRQKRGGGLAPVPYDHTEMEARWSPEDLQNDNPEHIFDRYWALNLLELTMRGLEEEYAQEGRAQVFSALKGVLGKRGGGARYEELAAKLEMTPGAVKTAVYRLRLRYREALRDEIALTIENPTAEAVEEELQELFRILAK